MTLLKISRTNETSGGQYVIAYISAMLLNAEENILLPAMIDFFHSRLSVKITISKCKLQNVIRKFKGVNLKLKIDSVKPMETQIFI